MKYYFVKVDGEYLIFDIMIKKVFVNVIGEEDSEEKERVWKFFV